MVKIDNKKFCENCYAETDQEPCPICGYSRAGHSSGHMTLPPGSILKGRYAVGRVIGKDGFGITYLAYDMKLEYKMTVKEYYPRGLVMRSPGSTFVSALDAESEATFKEGAGRFYNEARQIAKFNGNQNIVSVHNFFFENGTAYFTMSYPEENLLAYMDDAEIANMTAGMAHEEAVKLIKTMEETKVFGNSKLERSDIRKISFLDTKKDMPADAWDISKIRNGTVMAWTDRTDYRHLFIAAKGRIIVKSARRLFYGYSNLEEIEFIGCLDTSQATDMSHMFDGCEKLLHIDVSGFDTSRVTNMEGMFARCSSLKDLELSGFDTRCVTNMSYMFSDCGYISSVDVSGFDTSRVTDMSHMFSGGSYLSSVDVSGFDTSQVTDMSFMFDDCSILLSVDVSGFDTGQVTDMGMMFHNCSSLLHVDVSGFDTGQVTNMASMFADCGSLSSVDVSGFNTSQVTNMESMFAACTRLGSVDVSGFDTSRVTNMNMMFYHCRSLANVDMSGLDTGQVEDMSYVFNDCWIL